MTDGSRSEILFGGASEAAGAGMDRSGRETEAGGASWWQILSAAFDQLVEDPAQRELYGDPAKGATLAQSWRTTQLFGVPAPVCLLAFGQDRIEAAGISTLTQVPRSDLVPLVRTALNHRARSSVQLFVFDGRSGHSVTALSADTDGITFHDPWPGDSLLSKAYNAAGVDARRHGDLWHITSSDLERVLVAAFIPPGIWAAMSGRPAVPTLGELRASDLWSFFNLREAARDDSDPTYVPVTLQPGGFSEHIGMRLFCYEDEVISSAELALRQSWVIGPPMGINPFATDVAASWLSALVPATDSAQMAPLIEELRSLRLDESLKAKTQDPVWNAGETGRLIAAYLGLTDQSFATAGALSFLVVETSGDKEEIPWTRLSLRLG
ncbi:hypothetical protein [Kribbella swartbergensis]